MNSVCGLLQLLTVALVGVYAGAMLTEGFVLVPFWRSISPADFHLWYVANDARLLGFFGPLTSVAAITALVTAVTSLWIGHPGRLASVIACASILATLAMFFVYFQAANAQFSAASLAPADLTAELARWAGWHDARMVLSLVSLGFAVLALRRPA